MKEKRIGKRVWASLMALVMVLLLLPVGVFAESTNSTKSGFPKSDSSNPEILLTVQYHQTEARKALDLVNSFRTGPDAWYWNETDTERVSAAGLQKLTYSYDLERIAMQRLVESGKFQGEL